MRLFIKILARPPPQDQLARIGFARTGRLRLPRLLRPDPRDSPRIDPPFTLLTTFGRGTDILRRMSENQSAPEIGSKLPLLFTYTDTVFGDGFLAEVRVVNGRALCVHETDGFWMYGLNPGAMAAGGETPAAAVKGFRRTFSKILVDLATDAATLDSFRTAVEHFFHHANPGYESDWREAVDAVRNARVTVEGLSRVPADSPRSVMVTVKQHFRVEDNRAHLKRALAA